MHHVDTGEGLEKTYEIVPIAVLRAEVADNAVIHAICTYTTLASFLWAGLGIVDAVAAHDAGVFVSIVVFLWHN
jgi:hypothetical protein